MKLLPLLLGLALASCAAARNEWSVFGEPIYLNGKRVTDDQIKRALVYGPYHQLLENEKTRLLVDYELARQARDKSEGEAVAREQQTPFANPAERELFKAAAHVRIAKELGERYAVSDADFEAELQFNIDEFHKSYPQLDLAAEICRAYGSVDQYREELRQVMSFDRVFLEGNPAEWPMTTVEAIRADKTGGDVFLPDAQASYEARLKEADRNGGKLPREEELFMSFLRDIVRNYLLGMISTNSLVDNPDPSLVLWADLDGDGKPERTVTIEDLWERACVMVSEAEVDEAKRSCLVTGAVCARLEREGALTTAPDRNAKLAELNRSAEKESSSIADLASSYDFPSVESFAEYHRLRSAFERMIAAQLVDSSTGELSSAVAAHLPRAAYTLGYAKVDAEVLLISARDIPLFRWKKDGWEQARRLASKLLARYERNPSPERWSELVDKYSEFWDPPEPQQHDGQYRWVCRDSLKKGRFGSLHHGELMHRLRETPYTEWITGECIADRICFEQEENSVAGPFRGPLGWYLTRLTKRSPFPRPLVASDPEFRKDLKEDYVDWAFNQYTKEAVAQAEIKGWKPL